MYKKTQFGWVPFWITMPMIAISSLITLFAVPKDQLLIPVIVTCSLLFVLLIFKDLTVSVNDEKLNLRYGIGLVFKNIDLEQIASCVKVRNPWWVGWGIRIGPSFTLFNISGFDAVELSFKDGRRKIRIGTAEPDELAAAINSKIKTG